MLTAIVSGCVFFALADTSGLPLAGYDDALLHFAAFAAMTLLAVKAYPLAPLTHLLLAFGVLAGSTELLQFLPGVHRQPDLSDFGFDILGIDCALILVGLLRSLFWRTPMRRTSVLRAVPVFDHQKLLASTLSVRRTSAEVGPSAAGWRTPGRMATS